MGLIDHKHELFANIVRLRRLGRQLPGNADISAVRASLEEELGETVSRRFAARVLGVSHTALERWIRTGELPIVYAASGRREVPVPALLSLYEEVQADGRGDDAPRYVLAPSIQRQRLAADRLRIEDLTSAVRDDGHTRASARSLAYHRAIAQRMRRSTVEEARHALFRWRKQGRIDDRYADGWEEILSRPLSEIRRAIIVPGAAGNDLRQNSPFVGLLSEPERARIVREVA